ncbi:hypothetical protein GCM10025863_27510 [Microbacterium suwonense]|uniref:Uncharacterized protein n=1 Tax=Microbacterium suwonense TaxID=683047 RepID=A0ABM8FWN8_9MICO|nr:hypothetical protein GCM10025863_27510 [Microbacterium suwonense]
MSGGTDAAGRDQGLAGSGEGITVRVHDLDLCGGDGIHPADRQQILTMGDVDDTIGLGSGLLEVVEVAEVAAAGRGAERGDCRCGLVRADEARDLVARGDEFGDDMRAGMTGSAGDEYVHTGVNGLSPVYYSA